MSNDNLVFRYRFWLFTLTFVVGFSLGAIDHSILAVALLNLAGLGAGWYRAAFGIAALCVVLAALIRTWAAAYLQSSIVHDSRLHSEALVASGPYRYVRNPLYLGGLLLAVGLAMLASRAGAVVIIGGVLAITLALINAEERQLTAAQGESYVAYRKSLPRLLPSLTPRLPDAGIAPRWGQAFFGETMFWIFAFGMILFVITLQPLWIIAFACAAPVVHLLLSRALRSAPLPPSAGP
jgi:protein-S-isoprenylcysteine O-methyltransferase Ste14